MRARDYNPTTGRFTANDPVPVPTGMPFVGGYLYAYNNALVYSDPSGLTAIGQYDYADGDARRVQHSKAMMASLARDQAAAPSPSDVFWYDDEGTGGVAWLGVVNCGGGALNGVSSLVNGFTPSYLQIPSVGIVGDYDMYKGSSWIGSTLVFGGAVVEIRVPSGVADDATSTWPNLDGLGGACYYEGTQWTKLQSATEGRDC